MKTRIVAIKLREEQAFTYFLDVSVDGVNWKSAYNTKSKEKVKQVQQRWETETAIPDSNLITKISVY